MQRGLLNELRTMIEELCIYFTMEFNREKVEEHDHTFRGAPQDGLGPELWGITLEQLEAINDSVPRHYTMRDVVEHFVKPKTARTGLGDAPK